MSQISRYSLLGVFAFATLCFVAIGMLLGPELPAGGTPFYILAAICGAVVVIVWSPWKAAQRAAEDDEEIEDSEPNEPRRHSRKSLRPNQQRETAEPEPDESASPYQFDLTKLTAAGWLLLLVSAGVAFGIPIGYLATQGAANRGEIRGIALVGFVLAGVVFSGGRWGLQQQGIPLMKRPAKKRGAKANSIGNRSTNRTTAAQRKKRRPAD